MFWFFWIKHYLNPNEIFTAKELYYEWYNSIPNLDNLHKKIDPHGIFKFHQVGHQEFAWYLRTKPQIIDLFANIWNTTHDNLTCSFDGSCYIPDNTICNTKCWTHTDQAPKEIDLIEAINKETNHKGADVVFEVSGSQTGVDVMTECAATRGRIVMVAIHAEKPVVDMFRFFWRELELIGVRVYEKEDYEKAIKILESGGIDADTIITDVSDLKEVQNAFNSLSNSPTALKSLIKVGD